jgi:hypothetical protein
MQSICGREHAAFRRCTRRAPRRARSFASLRALLVRSIVRIEHASIARCAGSTEMEARSGATREAREVGARTGVIHAARHETTDVGNDGYGARARPQWFGRSAADARAMTDAATGAMTGTVMGVLRGSAARSDGAGRDDDRHEESSHRNPTDREHPWHRRNIPSRERECPSTPTGFREL